MTTPPAALSEEPDFQAWAAELCLDATSLLIAHPHEWRVLNTESELVVAEALRAAWRHER